MTIPSHESRYTPPTEEQKAAWAESADRLRRQQEKSEQWLKEREPMQRALLLAGPALRDVEAALACHCHCHPKVRYEHDGGFCHCQETPEEKERRKELAREALLALQGSFSRGESPAQLKERWAREKAELDAVATELGVEVHQCDGVAPFQIEAVVEGRSFYVRDRHERFTIDVAGPEQPLAFVEDRPGEGSDWGKGAVTIDSGASFFLYGEETGERSELRALRYATRKVRDWQRQQGCSHILTNERGGIQFRFCPVCGIRTEDVTGFQQ